MSQILSTGSDLVGIEIGLDYEGCRITLYFLNLLIGFHILGVFKSVHKRLENVLELWVTNSFICISLLRLRRLGMKGFQL